MAPLRDGFRIAKAPRFHDPSALSDRICINSGTIEAEGVFLPRPEWRAPTETELALLVADGPAAPENPTASHLCLFSIPEHLRSRWWTLAEGGLEQAEAWVPAFAREVASFLQFKGLPIPAGCAFDVVVTEAGQPATRADSASGERLGLGFDLAPTLPWPPDDAGDLPRILGGINLGDEETAIAFVNLLAPAIAEALAGSGGDVATIGTLARRFLSRTPDYPLVRVTLRPGDAYWLPRGGVIVDGYPAEKTGPDVILVLRQVGR